MLSTRKIMTTATVTHAGQQAIRLAVHTVIGRQVYALSPYRADLLRRELGAVLDRMRDDAKQAGGPPSRALGPSGDPAEGG